MISLALAAFVLSSPQALVFVASHDNVCSSEAGLFTDSGEDCKNQSIITGGGESSCSICTKSKVLELLIGERQERVVVSGSEGIFVSIKTTQKYHATRLPPILLTWLQTINPQQVCMCTRILGIH